MENLEQKHHHLNKKLFQESSEVDNHNKPANSFMQDAYKNSNNEFLHTSEHNFDEMYLSQHSFAESLHKSSLEIIENEQNTKAHLPEIIDEKQDEKVENTLTALATLSHVAQEAKNTANNVLYDYSKKAALKQYNKQLVQTRVVMYHQHNLRMVAENVIKKPEEQRLFVIRRVARELWTNFCVRGQESPMLEYLHDKLRESYKEDFQFSYKPGTTELIIMRNIDNELVSVSKEEKVEIVNFAWKLAQEIVAKYTT